MSVSLVSQAVPVPTANRGQSVRIYADSKSGKLVYANGKSIIIRSLKDPKESSVYQGHSHPTTVARFSPSGYYVASGDVMGNIKIWDSINEEHILKSEFKILSGPIRDIAWDIDSQRILAVGDGKDKFGHVFTFDSGNSLGVIDGHSKTVNACDMRQKRPFRAATCSDDMTVVFFHGPPFKFSKAIRDHTSFVNDVKYSPDGAHFVTVGSDSKIFLYDGLTGDLISGIGNSETTHSGSIYGVSWSPDSKKIATSSGDKTVKIWNVETKELEKTIKIGQTNDAANMQMGNLWTNEYILSVSLSGDINVLSLDASVPINVLSGHQKPITSSAIFDEQTIYTGSYDGRIYYRSIDKIEENPQGIALKGLQSQVNKLSSISVDKLVVGSMNDQISLVSTASGELAEQIKVSGAPKSMGIIAGSGLMVAQLMNESVVAFPAIGDAETSSIGNGRSEPIVLVKDGASCVTAHPQEMEMAVGFSDYSVVVYTLTGGISNLVAKEKYRVQVNRRDISSLEYSPNGQYLASGDRAGKIYLLNSETGAVVTNQWVYHTGAINGMSWFADSKRMASGSLDSNIYVWQVEKPSQHWCALQAHPAGVSGVHAVGSNTVVSCGSDSLIKKWEIVDN